MRPVYQSRTGKHGRCLNACIASLLEIPEYVVPDFGDHTWNADVDHFLAPYGLYYRRIALDVAPIGYHIIEGISPRGGLHAVVGRNGNIVFDPHPPDGTGSGLVERCFYGLLIRRFK